MNDRPDTYKGFAETMKLIIDGKISPPNLEPMENDVAVYSIATFHYHVFKGHFRENGGHTAWATYFLNTDPMKTIHSDGEGFVLHYARGGAENGWRAHGKAMKFAICKHKKTEVGHQPNHSRGWHPGHCELCGVDMSVDSGD